MSTQTTEKIQRESSSSPWWEATEEELAAQREAREAVMGIPVFPELEKRLIEALGFGPAPIMLHQLCYWFTRPKYKNKWWVYLTTGDWQEQRGLNRKQVDRGRKVLKALGIVQEEKGRGYKPFYRVDWVCLARTLDPDFSLSPLGDTTSEEDQAPPPEDASLTPLGGTTSARPPKGEQASSTPLGGATSHQETTQENKGQDNSDFQSGGDGSSSRPAGNRNKGESSPGSSGGEAPPDLDASPDGLTREQEESQREGVRDEAPSANGSHGPAPLQEAPPPPELDPIAKNKAWALIVGVEGESTITRFCDHYLAGRADSEGEPFTPQRIAEKVREEIGGEDPLEAFVPWVERCLEDLSTEREVAVG